MTTPCFGPDFTEVVNRLSDPSTLTSISHRHPDNVPLPSSEVLKKLVDKLREIIFPGFFGDTTRNTAHLGFYLGVYLDEVYRILYDQIQAGLCFQNYDPANASSLDHCEKSHIIATQFINDLPELRRKLTTDVEAAYVGDPAAVSFGEVIFCYPAIRAISSYRIAHQLHKLGVPLIPRIISEMAHSETGIDIHPMAEIGEHFTIDHGTGVVIGSTCIIGNRVKLYQGVTLGAKSFPLDSEGNPIKGIPRHPIVEDNVVIYAQATILGRVTIGENSVIGGNVWITRDIKANSKIIQYTAKSAQFIDGAGI
ncbi:MAG: serine O-acetyltransferase EpsC [Bacteroidota bacterium]|nr:serine O-acetyltransferase EpsC [Bacteroidota bacterium]MDP4205488.1 serine O-acetyltransferase EpsC [Bacteroidota bacterium]